MTVRKPRPAARLIFAAPDKRILLYRYRFEEFVFWITPGGACEAGEDYDVTARREMMEETGLALDPGPEVAQRTADYRDWEGTEVRSDERYFLIPCERFEPDWSGLLEGERDSLTDYRWWSREEIHKSDELIFPEDLCDMLAALLEAQ